MNKNSFLDNQIKTALVKGEDKILMNYDPLVKAKQRLKNESIIDGRISIMSLFHKKGLKVSLTFILAAIMLCGAMVVGAKSSFKTDKIDYPFEDDQQVIGKWEAIDFVNTVNAFDTNKKTWASKLYLKQLVFIKEGKVLSSVYEGNEQLVPSDTWTKGMVIDSYQKTASKYEIKNINGSDYMFYEWKTGDYILNGVQPSLYVLKRVDNNDYSSYTPNVKTDKIDYPFADDPQVIGKWKSVDLVKAIDKFNPENREFKFELPLTGLNFGADGVSSESFADGTQPRPISWTKGLVLNQKTLTASAYTIKEINGSTYMFFEWKSGDYTKRGMQPYYYVLKKEK